MPATASVFEPVHRVGHAPLDAARVRTGSTPLPGRAPTSFSTASPPRIFVWPLPVHLGGGEHDLAVRLVDRLEQRELVVERGALGELDVVGDRARVVGGDVRRRPCRGSRRGNGQRRSRSWKVTSSISTTTRSFGGVLLAPDLEARVDRVQLEVPERVGHVGDHPQRAQDRPEAEEHRDPQLAARPAHQLPARRAVRNSARKWKLWSAAAATLGFARGSVCFTLQDVGGQEPPVVLDHVRHRDQGGHADRPGADVVGEPDERGHERERVGRRCATRARGATPGPRRGRRACGAPASRSAADSRPRGGRPRRPRRPRPMAWREPTLRGTLGTAWTADSQISTWPDAGRPLHGHRAHLGGRDGRCLPRARLGGRPGRRAQAPHGHAPRARASTSRRGCSPSSATRASCGCSTTSTSRPAATS